MVKTDVLSTLKREWLLSIEPADGTVGVLFLQRHGRTFTTALTRPDYYRRHLSAHGGHYLWQRN